MKILLVVSLILNIVLGVLYFQEKNQPPLERIILEHSAFKETKKEIIPANPDRPVVKKKSPHAKAAMMVNTSDADIGELTVVQDEQSFAQASEELVRTQTDYLQVELELSDAVLKKKVKMTNDFYQISGELYKKTPRGVRMSFKDQRKVIELEEKLQQNYAKLMGQKKWEKYRNFVDDYNQKILKNHKSREFSPLMMSY